MPETHKLKRIDEGETGCYWKANLVCCQGIVSKRYLTGRDKMLPASVVEVRCPSWGGMSGGPVFDSRGMLVGLLSSSIRDEIGPSYVSLIWPALAHEVNGGWPSGFLKSYRTLLDIGRALGSIEDPNAVIYQTKSDGTIDIACRIWE